jgi:hypothetical protein
MLKKPVQQGRSKQLKIVLPSLLVISLGWGLIDLPLRASDECWFIWSISSIWLVGPEIHPEEPDGPERPANQTDEPGRVVRAQEAHRTIRPLLADFISSLLGKKPSAKAYGVFAQRNP